MKVLMQVMSGAEVYFLFYGGGVEVVMDGIGRGGVAALGADVDGGVRVQQR